MTWIETRPDDIQVRRGAWWTPGDAAPAVSVSERAADPSEASRPAPRSAGVLSTASSTCAWLRSTASSPSAPGYDGEFIFNRAALAGLPAQWFGAVRMAPDKVSAFQREAYRRFPSVTVINAADVISIVQEVVDQVALVVRFISAFAILAGAIILASTVAGTRLHRTREAAVLKTLGARRGRLVAIFSVEFAILGAVAGLMGGALATVFSRLLLTRLLDAKFQLRTAAESRHHPADGGAGDRHRLAGLGAHPGPAPHGGTARRVNSGDRLRNLGTRASRGVPRLRSLSPEL